MESYRIRIELNLGVLLAVGDFIQQNIEQNETQSRNNKKQHQYDLERSRKYFSHLNKSYVQACNYFAMLIFYRPYDDCRLRPRVIILFEWIIIIWIKL